MEDHYFISQDILKDTNKSLFGILDGHGGNLAA